MEFFIGICHRSCGIAVNRNHPIEKHGLTAKFTDSALYVGLSATDHTLIRSINDQQFRKRPFVDDRANGIRRAIPHKKTFLF